MAKKRTRATILRSESIQRTKGLKAVRLMHEKGILDDTLAMFAGVSVLTRHIEYESDIGPLPETEWLAEILYKKVKPSIERSAKKAAIGCLASGLVYYGCSKNQAFLALALWTKQSEATVKNAHKSYEDSKKLKGPNYFRFDGPYQAVGFCRAQTTPFPSAYPKAFAAFKKVIAKLGIPSDKLIK